MASPVVQLRVPEDTLARIDDVRGEESRTAWLLRLAERELTGGTPETDGAGQAAPAVAAVKVAGGEPSPGVVCFQPGCWQRDTSRFGLRRLPLCPACHAALEGREYHREVSPEAARLVKRGAA